MSDVRHIRLYTFPGSNAGATAELVLAHANVAHERVLLRPGLHAASLKLRGFPKITVPALQIDERKISGSRRIGRVIANEIAPDAGLLPDDPDVRARVLDAERAGERLQNAVRRFFYAIAGATGSTGGVRRLVDANYSALPSPLRAVTARLLVPAARVGHGARPERGPRDLARIVELLDLADQLVADGVLGTDSPNLADFQFAPNVIAMGEVDGAFGKAVRARPIWAPMHALLPNYAVSFGVRPPQQWLDQLEHRGGDQQNA